VAAPHECRSATGHAITLNRPLAASRVQIDRDLIGFSIEGTPADCVKLAVQVLLDQPPDLVVSGINDGANVGVNLLYSGTVAGAAEAALMGIPAVAVSLQREDNPNFAAAASIARGLIEQLLRDFLAPGRLVNINIPALSRGWPKGVQVVRQATDAVVDRFEPDTHGDKQWSYLLNGDFGTTAGGEQTDLRALRAGYVTLTPVQLDLTDRAGLGLLAARSWQLPLDEAAR
jgi:5'-nucleotidase